MLAALVCAPLASARAQTITDSLVLRALELEGNGQPRYAAPLYRRALAGSDAVTALLGLERTYAELEMRDSLLAPLDSVVARHPGDATVRAIQLRTLQALRRHDALGQATVEWARHAPRDPAPYRELARILLAEGRVVAADSVIRAAERTLGTGAGLAAELAQVRAASESWPEAAAAWRRALERDHWLAETVAYSLEPAPEARRAAIRSIFMREPVAPPARLALASLEVRWGSPSQGWNALRDLPADSASVAAWLAYGERAEAEGRWAQAVTAFESALAWRDDRALRLRTACAAFEAGDAAAALTIVPALASEPDSLEAATSLVPVHVRALAQLGRADDATRIADAYDRFIAPGPRSMLARAVAMGWVRAGDLARAQAALRAAGGGADSSSAAGWIALFAGDAVTARALFANGEERSAEVALALAVLARHRAARAPAVGEAFLALLRGDTARAAVRFAASADSAPGAASLLVLTAARLRLAAGDSTGAVRDWEAVATRHPDSPEAPEALLSIGRVLLARGEREQGIIRLEHLVLTYPASALVPVARREIELARQLVSAGSR